MKILVTGSAGFIGFHLCKKLIDLNYEVIGLDNLNNYGNARLKYARLGQLGISGTLEWNKIYKSHVSSNFSFVKMNLEDKKALPHLFKYEKFDKTCNLAAQPGVRYSIENPMAYVDSNLIGFVNLLECIRNYNVGNLVYASSSSVYGLNDKMPFSINDRVDHPISLYAATKKSNELIAYAYSHLYDIEMVGLRFFTVYGPWGRPDMAMFLFTEAVLNDQPVKVFNNGDLSRDFTYIDDIVDGVLATLLSNGKNTNQYRLYNIGNGEPVKLMDFILEIEKATGKTAKIEFYPMQPGDVEKTWADTTALEDDYEYKPNTSIEKGVQRFINWYKEYYLANNLI